MPKKMFRRVRHRDRSLGQSMVELAIVFPVLLLLVMVGLDFGRVYLGWINLQNMARIAANYAANNAPQFQINDPDTLAIYQRQVLNDATANNCDLPLVGGVEKAPAPTFTGYDVGNTVSVELDCTFSVLTPVISNVLGSSIMVSASSDFPVKSGIIAANNTGGGGGGGGGAVTASFSCTPKSGALALFVTCSDESGGGPTSWSWEISRNGTVEFTSLLQDFSFTLTQAGVYDVKLTADDELNQPSVKTRFTYLHADAPSVVDFSASMNAGPAPLAVDFTDTSTNSPTAWQWDFDGNGTIDSTGDPTPSHTYTAAGTYNVTLTVTNAAGDATRTKNAFILVDPPNCTVPPMTGFKRNNALSDWVARGFVGVNFHNAPGAPNGNFTVQFQSITPGTVVPCTSIIEVNDH